MSDLSHASERATMTLADVFPGLVDRLEGEANSREGARRLVEERWETDLAQYEGRDDSQNVARLQQDRRSTAFVNVTRPKCNTFESKLFDMLFPTDDRNFGVEPTPVPELDVQLGQLTGDVERLTEQANVAPDEASAEAATQQADMLAQQIAELEARRTTASEHADLMEDEIADNLAECNYALQCRALIHDATVCGTGFLKGPIPLNERVRKSWVHDANGRYRLDHRPDAGDRFAFQHVSFWHLFPEASARSFDQNESWMERHIMGRRDLREFAAHPGADADAIRRLLEEGPHGKAPSFMREVDALIADEQYTLDERFYVVWEYRGPLELEEMQALLSHLLGEEDGGASRELEDPLFGMDAVIWFCQGEIIRVGLAPLSADTGVYSAFQIEKSNARLWSVGIPYLMRTQQAIINDAWRGMMDNADFAAFPIVEFDGTVLDRVGGSQGAIEPAAVFERTSAGISGNPGIVFHTVPVNQQIYEAIIRLSMEFLDQETNISVLTSGDQGQTTQTAGGMALLMNSVNVVFRRVIKNFDDGITLPAITRSYHFLMEHSEKAAIKGDYAVQARGSSVLLVREVQAQNLLLLAMQASVHPEMGRHLKMRGLMKKLLASMMVEADDVLKTQQELDADAAAEAEAAQNAPEDPALVALQVEREIAQMEAQMKMAIAEMKTGAEQHKLAIEVQTALAAMQGRLQAIREQNQSKERMLVAEAAYEARQPPGVGGSGGYLG